MTSPIININSLVVYYGQTKALDGVSGAFQAGSLTAVAGPNGAGKSTLLKVIAGIIRPAKGFVRIEPEMKKKIGYLPQTTAVDREYPVTVTQFVSIGLWSTTGSFRKIGKDGQSRVQASLGDVGLSGYGERQIAELSGGQFQRMLFARLLLQDPQIILLDEPFAAVDAETIARLMQILLSWHRQGRTIICVLHDLMLIRKYFPESFVLAGKCLGRGHTHALFDQKLLSFDLDMAELVSPQDQDEGRGN
jgi:zinc/manganese transport system ATP-binding protein